MPAKFDRLVAAVKRQLRKDNPNLSEKELTSRAFAIATAQAKKAGIKFRENMEENNKQKIDDDGDIVVRENVRILIGTSIDSVGEVIED